MSTLDGTPGPGDVRSSVLGGLAATATAQIDRGRDAIEKPGPDWWEILKRTYAELGDDRVGIVAAGVAFYALLALFPALAALVSIYGLFADPATIGDRLQMLADVLPGDVLALIGAELTRIVTTSERTLGLGFGFGLFLSLWSANMGMKAIFDALNIVCEENETRSFVRLNLLSLTFTVTAVLIALLSIATVIGLPIVLDMVGLKETTEAAIKLARWPILLAVVSFAIAALYRYGPSRNRPPWPWVNVGMVAASLLWLLAAVLFSWYVANFADYNKTYGSLGTVVGLLMWNWLSVYIVLVGAELNSEIENFRTGRRMVAEQDPFPPYEEAPAT